VSRRICEARDPVEYGHDLRTLPDALLNELVALLNELVALLHELANSRKTDRGRLQH